MKRLKPINSSASSKRLQPKRQTAAELRALQRLMAIAVMRPLTAKQKMRPEWLDDSPTEKVIASFIKPNERLTSFERLEIYNRQYWFRVLECIYDDYPGVCALLGQKRFHNLAIAYLANHPSTSFTLRNLGRHLAEFIRAESKWVGADGDIAMEMAQLEWSHIEAFDNEARPAITVTDLAGSDASRLRLKLQPYIVLLELQWPLDDYLIALRENSRLRGEASNAMEDFAPQEDVSTLRPPKPKKTLLAVHRYNNIVYYKRLKPDQHALLTALKKGATLERALSQVAPENVDQIGVWFKDWAALGWFYIK
jgi:Putative DNA-binding domain